MTYRGKGKNERDWKEQKRICKVRVRGFRVTKHKV